MFNKRKNQDKMLLSFIKHDAVFIKLWCFSVEVAATARVEYNEQDKREESHEEEQPLPKTNGKTKKLLLQKRKSKFVFKCDAFLNTTYWVILKIMMLSV